MKKIIAVAVAIALLATSAYCGPPFGQAVAVTPSDTTDLANGPTQSIFVGGTGTLTVDMYNGGTVQFTAVPAGTTIPIKVKRIRATGTSATAIVAFL